MLHLEALDNVPVKVLCDDVVAARCSRRRGKVDRLEIPNVQSVMFGWLSMSLIAVGVMMMVIRWRLSMGMRSLLFRVGRDSQAIECTFELCSRC